MIILVSLIFSVVGGEVRKRFYSYVCQKEENMSWVVLFLLAVAMPSHVASQERCVTSAVSYVPSVAPYTLSLLSTTPPMVLKSNAFERWGCGRGGGGAQGR